MTTGQKRDVYRSPAYRESAFNCPYCGAHAEQRWFEGCAINNDGPNFHNAVAGLGLCFCRHCGKYSLWNDSRMVFPCAGLAPLPNQDLPGEIKKDYLEARDIVTRSPRGATALLRLAIQKLCTALGEKGNLNTAIANLVVKGLPPKIQKALDIVRVIGNNAVHPGELSIQDNETTAQQLFSLVNLIADSMISTHKQIEELYSDLPEQSRRAIEARDKKLSVEK